MGAFRLDWKPPSLYLTPQRHLNSSPPKDIIPTQSHEINTRDYEDVNMADGANYDGLHRFYDSKEFSDLTVTIRNDEGDDGEVIEGKICVHKIILAQASPVFEAMLKAGPQCTEVTVEGNIWAFRLMIAKLYNHRFEFDDIQHSIHQLFDHVHLFAFAKEYQIKHLQDSTEELIGEQLGRCTDPYLDDFKHFPEIQNYAARLIYRQHAEVAKEIRKPLVKFYVQWSNYFKGHEDFRELLRELPDFALDLVYALDEKDLLDSPSWIPMSVGHHGISDAPFRSSRATRRGVPSRASQRSLSPLIRFSAAPSVATDTTAVGNSAQTSEDLETETAGDTITNISCATSEENHNSYGSSTSPVSSGSFPRRTPQDENSPTPPKHVRCKHCNAFFPSKTKLHRHIHDAHPGRIKPPATGSITQGEVTASTPTIHWIREEQPPAVDDWRNIGVGPFPVDRTARRNGKRDKRELRVPFW